jgi:hypothetical protein
METMDLPSVVIVLMDLQSRFVSKRVVEIRSVSLDELGQQIARDSDTMYSCAYETQAERNLALRRAQRFLTSFSPKTVYFGSVPFEAAVWQ